MTIRKEVWEAARASLQTTVAIVALGKEMEELTDRDGPVVYGFHVAMLEAIFDSVGATQRALGPLAKQLAELYKHDPTQQTLPLGQEGK